MQSCELCQMIVDYLKYKCHHWELPQRQRKALDQPRGQRTSSAPNMPSVSFTHPSRRLRRHICLSRPADRPLAPWPRTGRRPERRISHPPSLPRRRREAFRYLAKMKRQAIQTAGGSARSGVVLSRDEHPILSNVFCGFIFFSSAVVVVERAMEFHRCGR